MVPKRPPRDDLDVRLEWPDAVEGEAAPSYEPSPARTAGRRAGSARRDQSVAPENTASVASALISLQGVVYDLAQTVEQLRGAVEAAVDKIDRMQEPARAQGDSAEIRDELAELARQMELLRKRVSIRARNEQLATETAERIAAAVVDNLVEVIPEVGPRLRSRRRTAQS